jgi:uncharacterized membrane protein
MTLFQLLLFAHLVGVVIWLGGALVGTMLGMSLYKQGDATTMGRFCSAFATIAGPMFGGSALLVLGTGIWMTAMDGAPSFSDLWVSLGFAGWILSTVLGATVVGMTWMRIGQTLQADGAQMSDADALYAKAMRVTWFDIVLRTAIVLLMVWQPT